MKKKTAKKKPVKKRSTHKKDYVWTKVSLVGVLSFLLFVIWIESSKEDSSKIPAMVLPKATHASVPKQEDIGQVISPILQQEPAPQVTFEDALPEPVIEKKAAPAESPAPVLADRHLLGLVIDDVGYSMSALQRIIALPFATTVAILPDAPHAEESARMAHQHGLTVMLHMPMQTSNPKYQKKMEQYYLHQDMSKEEFTQVFEAALAKVPYVQGVNNHMGSKLTENSKAMSWMMELCAKHNLFFIDSRTSSKSVAAKTADTSGIHWNARDVFLDHSVELAALQHAWDSSLKCVNSNDYCITLGHPHPETLDFLESKAQGLSAQSFVPVSQILKD